MGGHFNLSLYGSDLTADHIGIIVERGIIGKKLSKLTLTGDRIDDSSAHIFADGLRGNNTLRELDLRTKEISDEFAVALALTLQSNSTMVSLNLAVNHIGDKGTRALRETLCCNDTLQTVTLSKNDITTASIPSIEYMLEHGGRSLRDLYVKDNRYMYHDANYHRLF
jgi:Ran GTPase-activating protein (RanGAP) involved in mRNA processing and transport